MSLRVSGLRLDYGQGPVLDGLDLEVEDHECVVLLGVSGSGKSSLLRAIDLLEEIDDGQIELAGQDVADPRVDADAARARMSMVFQAYNLFPHMSVLENTTLALTAVHRQPRAVARERAIAMLERVGLADRAGAYPRELSGGQQQRVAIARAAVTQPELLLLDEVTSALDPRLVGEVLDLLTSLREDGMTMLVATHELSFARRAADRICFLHEGRVRVSGTPQQVLGSPTDEHLLAYLADSL